MEIGPQYLMPFNKNIIKEKELSIQIHMHGFSFCTQSSQFFFDYESTPINNDFAFKKILEDKTLLNFDRVSCIYFKRPATFVPTSLYDPSKKENYLKQNVCLETQLKIAEDDTINKKIKILHQVIISEQEIFKKLYSNITFSHYTKVLYNYLYKEAKSKNGIVMYLHLQNDFFDVMVFDAEQLLLYNSYPYRNEGDFLYFTLAVTEELSLSQEQFSIVFLGKYKRFDRYYKVLENYKRKLEFNYEDEEIAFEGKNEPAPFFVNIFD
jgi:hypothetical protein